MSTTWRLSGPSDVQAHNAGNTKYTGSPDLRCPDPHSDRSVWLCVCATRGVCRPLVGTLHTGVHNPGVDPPPSNQLQVCVCVCVWGGGGGGGKMCNMWRDLGVVVAEREIN